MTFADTPVAPIEIEWLVAGGSLGTKTPFVPYPNPDLEPGWSIRVTDMTGAVIAALPTASVRSVTWELNRPSTARFHIPKHQASAISMGSEVQIWHNDQLMMWGPVIGARGDAHSGAVDFDVADPMWYLERKYFGSAERQNRIRNGGFEQGLEHWTAVRCDAQHVSDGNVVRGDGAVRLLNRTDPNAYLSQYRVWEPTWPSDTWVVVTAWVWVSSTWLGPAHEERGLYVARRTYPDLELSGHRWEPITEDTPRGQWVSLTTGITMRNDQPYALEVRLYALEGVVRWDEARVLLHESTSLDREGNDQTEAARRIVVHSQTGRDKSSENIGTNTPPSGKHIPLRAWQHAAAQPIMEAIREFVDASDGFDVSVELTSNSRTFTTHSPRKGTDRAGEITLRTTGARNCAGMRYGVDLGRTAQAQRVRGIRAGVAAEEGGAVDPSALPHGQVLEHVWHAPSDTPVAALDRLAVEALRLSRLPADPIEVDVIDRGLVGLLETGDLVAVDIDDGWMVADGTWRIVRIQFNGDGSPPMTLTLNRWGEGEIAS